ncbi:MAG: hypothetical protein ABSB40_04085 [Nitrososphaeria archaeon]|jgi:hypothetical protein
MYPVNKIKENVKIGVDRAEDMTKEHPRIALTTAFVLGGLTIGGLAWILRGRTAVECR